MTFYSYGVKEQNVKKHHPSGHEKPMKDETPLKANSSLSTLNSIIKRHYPNFEELLNAVPDHRQRHTYEVAELLAAGLLMFVLPRTSRNHADTRKAI